MISDDEYLERIVAGVHSVTTSGAEVNWNETIGGRQFDVVVRFKLGTLSYLVLVEVKNKTRKASASDLDAFVSKSSDQRASKSVFVTAAGFQSGAVAVAKRHGIDIFTLSFDATALQMPKEMSFIAINKPNPENEPLHWSVGDENLINQIEDIKLVYDDGSWCCVPNEPSQMTYYMHKSLFTDGRSLHEYVSGVMIPELRLGEGGQVERYIDPPMMLMPADNLSFPSGIVSKIVLSHITKKGRPIKGNIKFDPGILVAPVIYKNEITGEASSYSLNSLPLGDRRVSVGNFYFIMNPLIYYYCDAIIGDKVRWHLIESFQSGDLIRATMMQAIERSPHYIRVRDRKTIARLQARLEDYLAMSAKGAAVRRMH